MIDQLKAKLPHDDGCCVMDVDPYDPPNTLPRCNCTRREILEWVEETEVSNKQWTGTMADLVKSIKDNAPPVLFQAIFSGVDRNDR